MPITNPIQKSEFFTTPVDAADLSKIAESYSGAEKSAFYMGMGLAVNLCSTLVDAEISKDTPMYRSQHDDGE